MAGDTSRVHAEGMPWIAVSPVQPERAEPHATLADLHTSIEVSCSFRSVCMINESSKAHWRLLLRFGPVVVTYGLRASFVYSKKLQNQERAAAQLMEGHHLSSRTTCFPALVIVERAGLGTGSLADSKCPSPDVWHKEAERSQGRGANTNAAAAAGQAAARHSSGVAVDVRLHAHDLAAWGLLGG